MVAVHTSMRMAGGRIRDLRAPLEPSEAARKQDMGAGTGPGEPGEGTPGKSAYQSWLDVGNVGTEADFVAWLKGEPGEDAVGTPGKSAYQSWLDVGNVGSEAEYVAWLKGRDGEDGDPGRSFYQRRVQKVATATGNIACDWSLYDEIRLTLTGNVVLAFSGAADGQGCTLKLKQDATGSRLVSLPANVRYSGDITGFTATTTANKSDRVGFINDADDAKYDFVSAIKGY